MTLLTCPSCLTGGHVVLYGQQGETPARCSRCITTAAMGLQRGARVLPAAHLPAPSHIVKRCSACGHQTFARRAYLSICKGDRAPHPHPARVMQSVVGSKQDLSVL